MAPPWHVNFNIDTYLNRIIPTPPWQAIPYPVSYFLGYRRHGPHKKYGSLLLTFRALLGIFVSLLLIQVLSHQIPWAAAHGPRIVASFGAAAVLEFCAFESPFAQPRNFLISQIIASVIGVSFSKLFHLRSEDDWVRWIGGALACATTTALMDLTKTVHPPAGATALLSVVDDVAAGLGWRLVPLVLVGCSVMLLVALLLNNVFSRFPVYWWTASDLATPLPSNQPSASSLDDGVKVESRRTEIIVTQGEIIVPDHIRLSQEETLLLERISRKLQAEGLF